MTDAKDQRMDQVDPAAQAIDDAIKLFEILKYALSDMQQKKSFELGITALRYMKGSLYDE